MPSYPPYGQPPQQQTQQPMQSAYPGYPSYGQQPYSQQQPYGQQQQQPTAPQYPTSTQSAQPQYPSTTQATQPQYPPSTQSAQYGGYTEQTTTAPTTQSKQPNSPMTIDTQHEDLIHDAQFDYYGKRLATASSDRTVRIFAVESGAPGKLLATLQGHEGPVWQIAWAHPRFGCLLASCSFDGSVIVWKESSNNQLSKLKEFKGLHEGSVNAVQWGPAEHGLMFATASSDGKVAIARCDTGTGRWETKSFPAHPVGVNSVSFAPPYSSDILISDPKPATDLIRLASGGSDNTVKVWEGQAWDQLEEVACLSDLHSDWVRDVAFSPADSDLLATCGQDRQVCIIRRSSDGNWSGRPLSDKPFADSLWRMSWSPGGTVLAVTGGDGKVTLWRESRDGEWELVSTVDPSAL